MKITFDVEEKELCSILSIFREEEEKEEKEEVFNCVSYSDVNLEKYNKIKQWLIDNNINYLQSNGKIVYYLATKKLVQLMDHVDRERIVM